MSIIAEFSIETESFALTETLPAFPRVTVEIDQIAAHVPDTTMPCFWVDDTDTPGFSERIANDPTVSEIQATADFEKTRLYYVEWSDEIDAIVTEMIDHEGVILEAVGQNETWRLRIRFMTQDQLETFQEHFTEQGPSFQLEQLFEVQHPRHTRGDITPQQYEALTTAVDLGYFQVPREVSIQELADELGVSHQTVSELIRRGTENLATEMLSTDQIRDGA